MTSILHRDFETRSTLDITDVGASRYAADPNTGVWCCAYAVDDGPIKVWTPGEPIPEEFIEAARDPDWVVAAHNDAFERAIEERILAPRYGWPIVPLDRHRCTMAMALACALPGKLKTVANVLELSARKDDDGARLMLEMARPRKPRAGEPDGLYWHDDPAKIDRLITYCKQDIEVERELFHRLPPLVDSEQALWVLDAIINARGFHTDGPLLDAASKIAEAANIVAQDELARITAGALTSTNQTEAMQGWLCEHGCEVEDIQKPTLRHALRRKALDPVVRRVMELRLGAAHSAAAKVLALLSWRNDDGRVRGTFRFHGAGTGRWTGLGVQPQNFKRDSEGMEAKRVAVVTGDLAHVQSLYTQPLEAVGDIARAMISAAPGHRFLVGDFSGIESRVLAWVSGEKSKLEMWSKFDQTGDPKDEPYYIFGRNFGQPEESARGTGKTSDLAFGYQGGIGAWDRLAPDDDASTDDDKKRYQQTWRKLHPRTVKFWGNVNFAAIQAVRNPNTEFTCQKLRLISDGNFLRITLPSGRVLSYPFPRLGNDKFGNSIVIFKDNEKGKFVDCRHGQGAYGGLWTENIVQAISRDLLAAAMHRLEAAGYPIVLHVHDEIVAEAPDGFGNVEEFTRLITALPDWANGLPVAAKVRNGPRFAKSEKPAPAPAEEVKPWEGEDEIERPAAPATGTVTAIDGIPIIDMDIDLDAIKAKAEPPREEAAKPNGHDRERGYSDGSVSEAARDTHADDNAGKPFSDAWLRNHGYRLARVFDYALPDGTVLYQQNRYELRDGIAPTTKRPKKRFLVHRTVNGQDVFGAGDRKVIYNARAVMLAGPGSTVFVCEGEKNADTLIAAGLAATTVLSHKWTPECVTALTGYDVIILEDHDDDGRKQSAIAAKELIAGAASLRIVPTAHLWKHLPPGSSSRDIQAKDDVGDWIDAGGDPARLIDLCRDIPDAKAKPKYATTNLSTVKGRAVHWIWPGHIARGALELLAGTPEIGKSQIQCQYIACATTGRAWPNGAPGIEPCRVIMLTAEDNIEDTLVPRLKAAGADLTMVEVLRTIRRDDRDGCFLLSQDLEILEQAINDLGAGLVTIDPITAYMGGGKSFDSHRATDVRSQLFPLKEMAERVGVAFSAITHPPKNAGPSALDHFIGSQAFIAAARVGHLCVAEMEAGEDGGKRPTGRRFFTNAKINVEAKAPTLVYTIDVVEVGFDEELGTIIRAPVVRWEGESEVTADEALACSKPSKASKTAGPKDFLSDILISGPVLQTTVVERGAERGISYMQLWRAKAALGVEDFKDEQRGPSFWALPGTRRK